MMNYKLEEKSISCEVCGGEIPAKAAGINEYHKDGIVKKHHACSNHIVDLYNKIIKEIENK